MTMKEFNSTPGEAQAILAKAEAKSKAIRILSEALSQQVSSSSSSLRHGHRVCGRWRVKFVLTVPCSRAERQRGCLTQRGRAVRVGVLQSGQRVQHHPAAHQHWRHQRDGHTGEAGAARAPPNRNSSATHQLRNVVLEEMRLETFCHSCI